MSFRRFGGLMTVALLFLGCSSSSPTESGAPSDGGTAGTRAGDGALGTGSTTSSSCASSPVVWKDDGTTHCATSAYGSLGTTTARDPFDGGLVPYTTLEVITVEETTGFDFSFSVTGQTDAADLSGKYSCTPSGGTNAEFVYDDIGVFSTTMKTCSIQVNLTPSGDGGTAVSGTFSATLNVSDGGVKTISDGTFKVSVGSE